MGRRPQSHIFYGYQIDPEFLENLETYPPFATGFDPYDIWSTQEYLDKIVREANIHEGLKFNFIQAYDDTGGDECCWYISIRDYTADWDSVDALDLSLPEDADAYITEALKLLRLKAISEIGWFHTASS